MKPKFKIGDIIIDKNNPECQREIVDIVKKSEKVVKGDWNGIKEYTVGPNSYVLKSLKTNKLSWGSISWTHKTYQLIQLVKEKSLKWENYEEILI